MEIMESVLLVILQYKMMLGAMVVMAGQQVDMVQQVVLVELVLERQR